MLCICGIINHQYDLVHQRLIQGSDQSIVTIDKSEDGNYRHFLHHSGNLEDNQLKFSCGDTMKI